VREQAGRQQRLLQQNKPPPVERGDGALVAVAQSKLPSAIVLTAARRYRRPLWRRPASSQATPRRAPHYLARREMM
jgi:hypothetical protein